MTKDEMAALASLQTGLPARVIVFQLTGGAGMAKLMLFRKAVEDVEPIWRSALVCYAKTGEKAYKDLTKEFMAWTPE